MPTTPERTPAAGPTEQVAGAADDSEALRTALAHVGFEAPADLGDAAAIYQALDLLDDAGWYLTRFEETEAAEPTEAHRKAALDALPRLDLQRHPSLPGLVDSLDAIAGWLAHGSNHEAVRRVTIPADSDEREELGAELAARLVRQVAYRQTAADEDTTEAVQHVLRSVVVAILARVDAMTPEEPF